MRAAYALIGVGFLVIIGALLFLRPSTSASPDTMLTLVSPAFENRAAIPAKYTCDGENANPALSFSGVLPEAKSLVLIVDDPDVPKGRVPGDVFDHWIVYNMPPDTLGLASDATPPGAEGVNTAGTAGYTGPCPPDREHRYFFRLYTLDIMLPLGSGASRAEVEEAMQGHVIQSAELMGLYNRPQNVGQ